MNCLSPASSPHAGEVPCRETRMTEIVTTPSSSSLKLMLKRPWWLLHCGTPRVWGPALQTICLVGPAARGWTTNRRCFLVICYISALTAVVPPVCQYFLKCVIFHCLLVCLNWIDRKYDRTKNNICVQCTYVVYTHVRALCTSLYMCYVHWYYVYCVVMCMHCVHVCTVTLALCTLMYMCCVHYCTHTTVHTRCVYCTQVAGEALL